MNEASKITVHMAASLDGFIARRDGGVDWMQTNDHYEQGADELDAQAVEEYLKSIDCYVMGARTYEHALELGWVYGDTPTVVVTHRNLSAARRSVEFFRGDLRELVEQRLKPRYRNIWMVGGANLTREFLRQGLADEIRIVFLPIVLGGGLPFFDAVGLELPLHLKEATPYKSGLVELCYEISRAPTASDA